MGVSRQARPSSRTLRGRHAIQRARPAAEVSRLRHRQLTLPRGVHRTRVSEMRAVRVCAAVRRTPTAQRHPFRRLERNVAARLPASTG